MMTLPTLLLRNMSKAIIGISLRDFEKRYMMVTCDNEFSETEGRGSSMYKLVIIKCFLSDLYELFH